MSDNNRGSDKKNKLKQYFFVVRQLAAKEIKHENSSKKFGQIWNILLPFVQMITMAVLFAFVFQKDIKEFMPYVFTGTIVYGFYNNAMSGCLKALSANKGLLIRTKIPKNLFVAEKVYAAFIRMLFSLVGYVIILIVTGTTVGPLVVLAPVGILFAVFISAGIGKILAVINVYFADISYFYKILMKLVFYGSAIFFQVERASPAVQSIMGFNPIYLTICFERNCILYNQISEPLIWVKLIIYSIVIFLIGSVVFKKGSQDVVAKL